MKALKQVCCLVTVLLMTIACNNSSVTTPSPAPFFPVQKDAKPDFMDALLVGELILVDGCLRLNDSDGNSFLLIWPRGFSMRKEKNIIQVVDNTGQLVAQVGDNLEISGGEIPAEYIAEYLAQSLPGDCSGPYWIVGYEINR